MATAGCTEGPYPTPASPTAPAVTLSSPPTSVQPGTITFEGLTSDGASVTSYEERGFTLRLSGGNWVAGMGYGNPRPFVQFTATGGTTAAGEAQLTGSGQTFSFQSVDVYASTTPIPYQITGSRNGATVFTISDRVPNTFGQFRTVSASDPAAVVDTLTIVLTNAAASCCSNPMGIDNIVIR